MRKFRPQYWVLLLGGRFPSMSGASLIDDGAVVTVGWKHKVLSPGVGKPTSEDSKSVAVGFWIPSRLGACLGEEGAVATEG